MAQPYWRWHLDDISPMRMLMADCQHGHRLSDGGDRCDYLILYPEELPWRGVLWNEDCHCKFDVLVERDWRVYWLNELCVKESLP